MGGQAGEGKEEGEKMEWHGPVAIKCIMQCESFFGRFVRTVNVK